jgi:serine protease Do
VITSYHVVDGAFEAVVRLQDGSVLPIEAVTAESPESDLVRLRVRLPEKGVSWLPVAGEPPEVAEPIVVLGSPMGLERTVSEGIINPRCRD